MHPYVQMYLFYAPYNILLHLKPDNFTHQGESLAL